MKSTHLSWRVDFLYTVIIRPFVPLTNKALQRTLRLRIKFYIGRRVSAVSRKRELSAGQRRFQRLARTLASSYFPSSAPTKKSTPKRVLSLSVTNDSAVKAFFTTDLNPTSYSIIPNSRIFSSLNSESVCFEPTCFIKA